MGRQVRIYGWLYRYNYPSFSDKKGYKIPRLGTRMALDSTRGLLYVATVKTPDQTTGAQHIDQAAGVGDVEIFDLNTLRDGKVPDGADLKPIASLVIPSGTAIRGLELFDNGKSLFVLTTKTGRSMESHLVKYDTETRKPDPPKKLFEPAWDMRKSADGKSLLVLDWPDAKKTASIRIFNPADLTAKARPLGGIANDMAQAKGGQFAATVQGIGPNSNKVVLISEKRNNTAIDFELGFTWRTANNGYVEFSPDGKLLFVSSYRAKGLDVYEVNDPDAPNGLKKKASIQTAGGREFGGHFYVSPDGDYLVDHHGLVLATANVGGSNGEAVGGAIGGGPPAPARERRQPQEWGEESGVVRGYRCRRGPVPAASAAEAVVVRPEAVTGNQGRPLGVAATAVNGHRVAVTGNRCRPRRVAATAVRDPQGVAMDNRCLPPRAAGAVNGRLVVVTDSRGHPVRAVAVTHRRRHPAGVGHPPDRLC